MALTNAFAGVEVFITASRAGSFTAAATRLGITKSAVAKAVSQLEARLDVKLLHRTTRRLSLTPEGAAFLEQAEASLDQLHAAEEAARSKAATVRGVLRIDMPAAFGRQVAMPILLEILRDHPDLRLAASFSDRVIDPVEEGVDLCLRFGELPDRRDIAARRLGSQRLVICAAPAYLAAAGNPADLNDLRHHACILGSRPGGPVPWRLVDDEGRALSIEPPATHLVSDGEAILAMTLAGIGLCQMPRSLVQAQIDSGALSLVLPDHCRVESPFSAVWPAARRLLPKVRVVVDAFVRRASAGAF